jgi:hypothetical protein
MIAPNPTPTVSETTGDLERTPDFLLLARYGRVPQVARFAGYGSLPERGALAVVSTERGEELALILQILPAPKRTDSPPALTGELIRLASVEDTHHEEELTSRAESDFPAWLKRAAQWKLQLELIDTEYTLDERLILYVLNDRNAETTRLALLAAAGGFGIVHVQPVSATGIVQATSGGGGGGCGSCSTEGGCH